MCGLTPVVIATRRDALKSNTRLRLAVVWWGRANTCLKNAYLERQIRIPRSLCPASLPAEVAQQVQVRCTTAGDEIAGEHKGWNSTKTWSRNSHDLLAVLRQLPHPVNNEYESAMEDPVPVCRAISMLKWNGPWKRVDTCGEADLSTVQPCSAYLQDTLALQLKPHPDTFTHTHSRGQE